MTGPRKTKSFAEIRELGEKQTAGNREILSNLAELTTLAQREFLRQYVRDQMFEESHCPNVFLLRPMSGSWVGNLFSQPMELQLFCQQPGCWHPVGEAYQIANPRPWLQKVGGYVGRLARYLKFAMPVLGAATGVMLPDVADAIRADIELMNTLAERMPELRKSEEHERKPVGLREGKVTEVRGATLRAIREFLHKLDPSHLWGDLEKVHTPEGHYLWLCQKHAKEYRGKAPAASERFQL